MSDVTASMVHSRGDADGSVGGDAATLTLVQVLPLSEDNLRAWDKQHEQQRDASDVDCKTGRVRLWAGHVAMATQVFAPTASGSCHNDNAGIDKDAAGLVVSGEEHAITALPTSINVTLTVSGSDLPPATAATGIDAKSCVATGQLMGDSDYVIHSSPPYPLAIPDNRLVTSPYPSAVQPFTGIVGRSYRFSARHGNGYYGNVSTNGRNDTVLSAATIANYLQEAVGEHLTSNQGHGQVKNSGSTQTQLQQSRASSASKCSIRPYTAAAVTSDGVSRDRGAPAYVMLHQSPYAPSYSSTLRTAHHPGGTTSSHPPSPHPPPSKSWSGVKVAGGNRDVSNPLQTYTVSFHNNNTSAYSNIASTSHNRYSQVSSYVQRKTPSSSSWKQQQQEVTLKDRVNTWQRHQPPPHPQPQLAASSPQSQPLRRSDNGYGVHERPASSAEAQTARYDNLYRLLRSDRQQASSGHVSGRRGGGWYTGDSIGARSRLEGGRRQPEADRVFKRYPSTSIPQKSTSALTFRRQGSSERGGQVSRPQGQGRL